VTSIIERLRNLPWSPPRAKAVTEPRCPTPSCGCVFCDLGFDPVVGDDGSPSHRWRQFTAPCTKAMTNSAEWLRNLARNYADGVPGMKPEDHYAWDIAIEVEQLQATVKAADILRARWLNDGHELGEKERTRFREAREAYDDARAALEPKP
jgi:hypothetical protein